MSAFMALWAGLDWMTLLGLFGTATYVFNYSLLASRVINSESLVYFIINTIAASLVLIGLAQHFNLPSAILQMFWIVIGVTAVLLRVYRWRRLQRLQRLAASPPASIPAPIPPQVDLPPPATPLFFDPVPGGCPPKRRKTAPSRRRAAKIQRLQKAPYDLRGSP